MWYIFLTFQEYIIYISFVKWYFVCFPIQIFINAQPFAYDDNTVLEYLDSPEMGISEIKQSPADTKVSFNGRLSQVNLN